MAKRKVAIIDDTPRENVARVVPLTKELRAEFAMQGRTFPNKQSYVLLFQKENGRQVQRPVGRRITFEGKALTWAMTRASRWMRSGRAIDNAPRHIQHACAAFKAADPKAFTSQFNTAYG